MLDVRLFSTALNLRPSPFNLLLCLLQRLVVSQGQGGLDFFLRDGEGADWQWPDRTEHPEADVMSDGNKRKMSEVGVINQHYLIVLKGNEQKPEVNSNQERLRAGEDFKWSPNVWYRLKARVERNPDGSAVVQAKAWKRGEPEPAAWTITVPHKTAHQAGSPGLFGFSPQDMPVYIDNVEVISD